MCNNVLFYYFNKYMFTCAPVGAHLNTIQEKNIIISFNNIYSITEQI